MAGVKLHLATPKIWEYFFENVDRLQDNEDCIAENKDNGMSLYLTANTVFPQLVLYADDRPVLYRYIRSKDECGLWAVYLITKFVAGVDIERPAEQDEKPKVVNLPVSKEVRQVQDDAAEKTDEYEDDKEQKILDIIYEREDELSQAMGDLLAVILCEEDGSAVKEMYGKELVSEAVDDFLQYLSDTHNISVYRPTLETDPETGEEVLKEFPYGWDENYEDIE